MNLNSLKAKLHAREGVTLVELLVVILIVTILSVSLLPLLQPFITEAKYAAEPIPTIGSLRTKIELYRYNHNYLPGMPHDLNTVITANMSANLDAISKNKTIGGDSTLISGKSALQTLILTDATPEGETESESGEKISSFKNACLDMLGETLGSETNGAEVVDAALKDHFAAHIDVDYLDLTGKNVKPNHFQYRAIFGGYNTGAYAYVVGVFGDSIGLPSGTGYAVIEIVNPKMEIKKVGTWKRYKTVDTEASQIFMRDASEYQVDASELRKKNVCWLGSPNDYLGTSKTEFDAAIKNLELAGWEF